MNLATIKSAAEKWIAAHDRYSTFGGNEAEAEAAFNDFVLSIDAKTVLRLITAYERHNDAVNLLAWLKLNCIAKIAATPDSAAHMQLCFEWRDAPPESIGIEDAIRNAMQNKPRIMRLG